MLIFIWNAFRSFTNQTEHIVQPSCHGLAPANSKEPRGCSLAPACPGGMGRRIGRKKAKFVGWDKDSLTEQQRKRKPPTIILIKEYTKMWLMHNYHQPEPKMPRPHLSTDFLSPGQLPQLYTERGISQYQNTPLASLGQPFQLCLVPTSCEN